MTKPFYWVGISGMPGRPSIGLGKSTLAGQLRNELLASGQVQNVAIVPMASGLKQLAELEQKTVRGIRVYNLLRNWGIEQDVALEATNAVLFAFRQYPSRKGIKNRKLLQVLGTEVGRDMLGPGFWVALVIRLGAGNEVVISDDVRFDNEAETVDLHVAIDPDMDPQAVERNHQELVASYGQSDLGDMGRSYLDAAHRSEQSLTHRPALVVAPRWPPSTVSRLASYVICEVVGR